MRTRRLLVALTTLIFTLGIPVAETALALTSNAVYLSHTGVLSLTGGTVAQVVAVPDDGKFLQMAPGSTITLMFPDPNWAVPDGTAAADLQVDIFDVPFPAWAEVLTSGDGTTWYSHGMFADTADINLDLSGPAKYVRLVQPEFCGVGVYCIDQGYPVLGFDLDAVIALHAGTPVTTSCPAGAAFVSAYSPSGANPAPTPVVSVTVDAGATYVVTVSGTYFAGGNSLYDIQADAEYSQDAYQRLNLQGWTPAVHNYGAWGEGLLDLKIDGAIVNWGAYSPSHTYSILHTAVGPQVSFQFQVYDIYAPNNVGGLCVSLTKVTAPVITPAIVGTLGLNDWYRTNVDLSWTVDNGGLPTLTSGCDPVAITTDTAGVTIECSATNAVGTTTASVTLKRDATAPNIVWVGGIADGDTFAFGSVPAAPTCIAVDAMSGGGACDVTGYAASVGSHTLVATAYDLAGNSSTESRTFTVGAWTFNGFFRPVDMDGVWNLVKGGSTVPLKFEVFAGATEVTDPSQLTFASWRVACPAATSFDPIELLVSGGNSLRYDFETGQFIQNWQTPKLPGACFIVTMTTPDGSSLEALFKLK